MIDRDQLFEHFLPLAQAIAKNVMARKRLRRQELDALVAAAQLGIWVGLGKWRPDGGRSLRNWVWLTAQKAIMDYLREQDPLKRNQRLSSPELLRSMRSMHHLAPQSLHRFLQRISHMHRYEVEDRDEERHLLSCLTEQERVVVRGIVFEGKLHREIAAEMGCHESYVSQIYARAREVLQSVCRHGRAM